MHYIFGVLSRYDISPAALRGLMQSPGIAESESTYDGEKLFRALEAGFKKVTPPKDDDSVCVSACETLNFIPVTLPDGKTACLWLHWPDFFPDARPDDYDELYPEAYLIDAS